MQSTSLTTSSSADRERWQKHSIHLVPAKAFYVSAFRDGGRNMLFLNGVPHLAVIYFRNATDPRIKLFDEVYEKTGMKESFEVLSRSASSVAPASVFYGVAENDGDLKTMAEGVGLNLGKKIPGLPAGMPLIFYINGCPRALRNITEPTVDQIEAFVKQTLAKFLAETTVAPPPPEGVVEARGVDVVVAMDAAEKAVVEVAEVKVEEKATDASPTETKVAAVATPLEAVAATVEIGGGGPEAPAAAKGGWWWWRSAESKALPSSKDEEASISDWKGKVVGKSDFRIKSKTMTLVAPETFVSGSAATPRLVYFRDPEHHPCKIFDVVFVKALRALEPRVAAYVSHSREVVALSRDTSTPIATLPYLILYDQKGMPIAKFHSERSAVTLAKMIATVLDR